MNLESGRTFRRTVALSAEDAGWTIREAAWGLEERVLWRGSDAARDALETAGSRLAPLQRLIQTRLTWPISDAFRAQGTVARRAIASGAAAVALAAATAGALSVPGADPATNEAIAPASPIEVISETASETTVLQGVAPTSASDEAPAAPPPPATKPSEPPAQLAWRFAKAFVAYEVGRSNEKTAAAFAATATPPLAKALAEDPPRLPADAKVPEARVLNVVLGETTKREITASVSLVRMRPLSEIRLTLTKKGDGWRVAQVLG